MQTLLAVIEDLFSFTLRSLFGHERTSVIQERLPQTFDTSQLRLLPVRTQQEGTLVPHMGESIPHSQGDIYFIGEDAVPLYTDPVVAFDNVRLRIPYGAPVLLRTLGGRWACVQYKEYEGWVLKDVLQEQQKDVQPRFQEGVLYDALHPETIKLRNTIHDEFGGSEAHLILTDAEYVTYKLLEKGLSLPWQDVRPRIVGTWQKLLRGKSGIHLGIKARTGSIMEYTVDDVGHVAYVESVSPDEGITVSSIGLVEEGEFTKRTMPLSEYRELHPVFIELL